MSANSFRNPVAWDLRRFERDERERDRRKLIAQILDYTRRPSIGMDSLVIPPNYGTIIERGRADGHDGYTITDHVTDDPNWLKWRQYRERPEEREAVVICACGYFRIADDGPSALAAQDYKRTALGCAIGHIRLHQRLEVASARQIESVARALDARDMRGFRFALDNLDLGR